MSEIRVENIIGETGTDAVNFTKGVNVTGIVTATSFAGSGANLTGISAGKIVQVKSVSKLDSFTVASPTAHQYYDVTGLDNLQITTTGSNKVIVHMTVHMGIDRDGYNGFFKGVRITSGVYYLSLIHI